MSGAQAEALNATLECALQLAERGYAVFPCYPDKRPATNRGFYDATRDSGLIRKWFSDSGRIIGVPTGLGNDLFVVDIDPQGKDWLIANEERLGARRRHETKRGKHYLYKHPSDNPSGTTSTSKIALGVDTRGEGGYVIWWPAEGFEVEGELDDMSEPPSWLLEQLNVPSSGLARCQSAGEATIPKGVRNETLFREAAMLRRKGLEQSAIYRIISQTNSDRCTPPLPDKEVGSVAKSVMRYDPDPAFELKAIGADASLDWLDEFRLTDEEIAALKDPEWAIENIAPRGHVVAIAAPPGAGKTTVLFHLATQYSDEFNVVFVHADTNPSDAKSYYERAKEHNVNYLTPDMIVGKSMSHVVTRLEMLANSDADLDGELWIFDTLKKMTDMIDKRQLKELLQILRKLSSRGMTLILLAHTNKHKDAEGKLVFEGTGDLRADVDELIYFEPMKKEDGNLLVSSRPDKVRADLSEMSFEIAPDRTVSVCKSYVDVAKTLADEARLEKDEPVIEIIRLAIVSGETLQSEIINFASSKGSFSVKQVQNVLNFYAKDTSQQLWVKKREKENNALRFSLVEDEVSSFLD